MRTLLAVLTLSACSAGASPDPSAARLDRVLAGYTAGESQACISADRGQTLVIENRSTVVAHRGGTLWVNRLGHECPGFDPPAALIVEVNGSQYCKGDRVKGLPIGQYMSGPFCVLGDFTPYRKMAGATSTS